MKNDKLLESIDTALEGMDNVSHPEWDWFNSLPEDEKYINLINGMTDDELNQAVRLCWENAYDDIQEIEDEEEII